MGWFLASSTQSCRCNLAVATLPVRSVGEGEGGNAGTGHFEPTASLTSRLQHLGMGTCAREVERQPIGGLDAGDVQGEWAVAHALRAFDKLATLVRQLAP